MIELRNEKIAVPVVLFAGLLWSFGPLVVRYMNDPHLVPWQYIFGRGLTIFLILNLYLYFEEGINFYKNYQKIGISGVIGGSGLGIAMISFIYSITNTSAAITLLCLAAMPFFTALLAFLFLKEKISLNVWISILIATIGIVIMAMGNTEKKSLVGFVFGISSSIGFSIFSVTLRWRKETPKFTTVAFAGFFCFIFAIIVILTNDLVFFFNKLQRSFVLTTWDTSLFWINSLFNWLKGYTSSRINLIISYRSCWWNFLGMVTNFRN